MRSVADELRRQTHADLMARTPGDRISVALALGDADVEILARYRGISLSAARDIIARQRQMGRVRSACHESLLR